MGRPALTTCLGCGHFRSDPCYLPELKSYLQQLLADRERIRAAIGLQEWARAQLTPRDEEITQLRELIRRIETDVSEQDQARIAEAITVIRKTRQVVNLGMPTTRRLRQRQGEQAATTPETPLATARRRDADRRRQRV